MTFRPGLPLSSSGRKSVLVLRERNWNWNFLCMFVAVLFTVNVVADVVATAVDVAVPCKHCVAVVVIKLIVVVAAVIAVVLIFHVLEASCSCCCCCCFCCCYSHSCHCCYTAWRSALPWNLGWQKAQKCSFEFYEALLTGLTGWAHFAARTTALCCCYITHCFLQKENWLLRDRP